MKDYTSDQIRNVSIIGSAHSGKTSISDAILFNAGATNRQGNVDDGSSLLDFDTDEISRNMSIYSSSFLVEQDGCKVNFIDTPGYPAFISQVTTAINVCESSLVTISAADGVEVLTRKVWREAMKLNQSLSVAINKMERENVKFDDLLLQVQTKLSKKIVPLTYPIGEGTDFKGYVDVLTLKGYTEDKGKAASTDIPEDIKTKVEAIRLELMESAAEGNEELLDKYLEQGELSDNDLLTGVKLGIVNGDIIPLYVCSAHKNTGIQALVKGLAALSPNPLEKKIEFEVEVNKESKTITVNPEGEALMQIFKIIDDPKVGEYFFFKVLQGKVEHSLELVDVNSQQKERIGHLFAFNGKNREEVNELNAGDIGATAKLKHITIGDTLYAGKEEVKVKPFEFANGLIEQAIVTESEKDREKIGEGLQTMNHIDPCFRHEYRPEFNEMIVSGMSQLHLEIMLGKIKAKYKINLSLDKPRIPYRETITKTSETQGKYKKQTGGHGQYGDCWLRLEPRQVGEGYEFVDKIVGGVIPSKYIPAVDKGVQDAMTKGIVAGYPVVDVRVTVYDGSHHSVDSSDLAFQMAGIMAFKKAAENAAPILLEPIMVVSVIAPDDYVGDISADFNQRRGKIISMNAVDDEYKEIKAYVPLAEMYQYSIDLKSMTKGEGVFSQEYDRYEPVPSHIAKNVIAENKEQDKE